MPAGDPQPGETWHDVLHGHVVLVNNVDGRNIHYTSADRVVSHSRVQFLARYYLAREPCIPGEDLLSLLGTHQHYLEQEAASIWRRVEVLNILRIVILNPMLRIECTREFGIELLDLARSYGTTVGFTAYSEEGYECRVLDVDGRILAVYGMSARALTHALTETPVQTAPEPEAPTLWERLGQ